MPMNTQEILNIVLIIFLLVVTGVIIAISYFLIKALRSITTLTDYLGEKIQMKALSIIPPLLVGIFSRIFKKRG